MSNETRVLALFEEANPVPDEQVMDHIDVEPATYLATLQQRSSDVTQLDEKIEKQDKAKRVWVWAAAALVVIAGLIAILTSQNTDESPPITEPPPTTIAETAPANLLGSWSSGGASVLFEGDSYAFVINDVLMEYGTFVVGTSPGLIEFVSAEGSPGCEPGAEGTKRFEATGDTLRLTLASDECFARQFKFEEFSRPMTQTNPIDLDALATDLDIEGYWGSDRVGAVFEAGRYTLVNGDLVETGTYEYSAGPYRIELTSDDRDSECASAVHNFTLIGGETLLLQDTTDTACTALFLTRDPLAPSEPFEIPDTGTSGSG